MLIASSLQVVERTNVLINLQASSIPCFGSQIEYLRTQVGDNRSCAGFFCVEY